MSGHNVAVIARRLCIASVAAGLAMLSGCSLIHPGSMVKQAEGSLHQAAKPASTQVMPASAPADCTAPPTGRYLGVSVAHSNLLSPTEQAMGITANITSLYYAIGQQVDVQAIQKLCAEHIFPIIEIDTNNVPTTKITSGAEDKYLQSLALELGNLQVPVGIDLNHEFNGPWFAWSTPNVTSAQFVAAWRHMVTLFRDNGATNVKWIWNPNVMSSGTAQDLRAWYPGDAYVDWVGWDGYFYLQTDTFASVFGQSISYVRSFTKRPQLIVETGANPDSGRSRAIQSIFAGAAETPGLIGLIWFDYDKTSVHDWYINNDPSALTAFRSAAATYLKSAG